MTFGSIKHLLNISPLIFLIGNVGENGQSYDCASLLVTDAAMYIMIRPSVEPTGNCWEDRYRLGHLQVT